jgi:hypothetical protein
MQETNYQFNCEWVNYCVNARLGSISSEWNHANSKNIVFQRVCRFFYTPCRSNVFGFAMNPGFFLYRIRFAVCTNEHESSTKWSQRESKSGTFESGKVCGNFVFEKIWIRRENSSVNAFCKECESIWIECGMKWEKRKPGMRKAGICKYRNEKSRNL